MNSVKEEELKEMQDLAGGAGLEIRQAIDTLKMLSQHAGDVDDKDIALMSTPSVLARALGVTLEKIDEIWSYFHKTLIISERKQT